LNKHRRASARPKPAADINRPHCTDVRVRRFYAIDAGSADRGREGGLTPPGQDVRKKIIFHRASTWNALREHFT